MVQAYMDNSGLYRKYGVDKTTPQLAGEYKTYGQLHVYEVEIVLANAATGVASVPGTDNVFFPIGARLQEVEVITKTAATGSGAVLNLGLCQTDRTSTAPGTTIAAQGLIAALPVTSMDTAGETTTLRVGSTYAGTLLGASTSATLVSQLIYDYDTAAFTAGVIKVTIKYYVP